MILIEHGTVITLDRERRILADGSVLVDGRDILQVGRAAEVTPPRQPDRVIDARRAVVLPGFVDTHVHLSEHLTRGLLLDDIPVDRYLPDWLIPLYSVITPEGCAAILWGDNSKAPAAAEALKLTSDDLYRMSVIDEIIPEPPGGAHQDPKAAARELKAALKRHLYQLVLMPPEELQAQRWDKYRNMGVAEE